MYKQYVVVETNADNDVVALWGPFVGKDEANQWSGIPASDPATSYHIAPLFEAPDWVSADE
jgi:hypothetical protein